MPHQNEPNGAQSSARVDLPTLLDAACVEGLAVDKQPTGYTASIFLGLDGAVGKWTDRVFASTASEAIEKALVALGPRQEVQEVRVALAPPSTPSVLAPPPY